MFREMPVPEKPLLPIFEAVLKSIHQDIQERAMKENPVAQLMASITEKMGVEATTENMFSVEAADQADKIVAVVREEWVRMGLDKSYPKTMDEFEALTKAEQDIYHNREKVMDDLHYRMDAQQHGMSTIAKVLRRKGVMERDEEHDGKPCDCPVCHVIEDEIKNEQANSPS